MRFGHEAGLPLYLWFDQDQIDEQHHKVMFDIFVGKALASRTLGQPNSFAERSIICFAIRCIKSIDWETAFNADWHGETNLSARFGLTWNATCSDSDKADDMQREQPNRKSSV